MAIDPICGMQVPETSPIRAERDGQVFYFCCEHCRRKFLGEPALAPGLVSLGLGPAQSLSPAASCCGSCGDTTSPQQHASGYFCPMCPEVHSDSPGVCPVCGMALEYAGDGPAADDDAELREMTWRFWLALALGGPVFALAMLPMLGVPLDAWISHDVNRWCQFALTLPTVFVAGWPLWTRAARSFRSLNFNMFTLISLGVGASLFYSVAALFAPQAIPAAFHEHGHAAIYFESAAMITALVLLGQMLEQRARQRTGDAIRELLALAPPKARRVTAAAIEEVDVAVVCAGDQLQVLPGDKIPVDGAVIEGASTIDEALLTGEATPVRKTVGDAVVGGTINLDGAFRMRAQRVGRETVLAQIVELVRHAQRSRAPVQQLADRVARIFVPAVVTVAILTFCAWALSGHPRSLALGLISAVSVLIIACPCALGLATPMSVTVGIGRGACEGILIKDAVSLEKLAQLQTLVVDKTGTLTAGSPQVTDLWTTDDTNETQLLRWASAVEQTSEHPLARAILRAARERNALGAVATDFHSVTGEGVLGRLGTELICLGNQTLLSGQGVEIVPAAVPVRERWEAEGKTVVFVAVERKLAGMLAISDPIKPTTPVALAALRQAGVKLVMLTGDQRRTAMAVAKQLQLTDVHAEVSPRQKIEIVQRLRAAGQVVGMAGDGVNDAPALAAADVGIAMGTGAGVAIESAGVTLLSGDLRGVGRAIRLGRRTMANIRQNLAFAFLYNLLGIPLAAGVLYPLFGVLLNPMVAGAAMSLSCVSIILNALRLRSAN